MPPPPPNSPAQRPLPGAVTVGLLAVPDSAPPYDDDMVPAVMMAPADGTVADDSHSLPSDRSPGCSNGPDGGTEAGAAAAPGPGHPAGPAPRDAAGAWPSQFAQVLAETLAGSRSHGQIAPWTSDQARRRIRQLGPMLAAGTVPRVRRIVTTCPAAGVVEMTVVVGCGTRVRALAVRLERDRPRHLRSGPDTAAGRWVCTAVEAA